ncbi:MAG: NAD(P)/FAD-dependent oxidoreductase [bacterium]
MDKALSIAGGGLAGLACGIRLRERGWQVTVHERGRYPLKKVCGEFLSPRGWARVVALGAAKHLSALPQPLRSARFYSGTRFHADVSLYPHAFWLSRGALDQAMAARFVELGGELHEGSALDPALPGIVDATGRHSVPAVGAWMAWKGYLPADRAPIELDTVDLLMLPLPKGYAGLSRVEDGRVSVCLTAQGPVRLPLLLDAHPVLRRCSQYLEAHAAIAGFAFTGGPNTRAVGDARRVFPPVVGDGMTQALRSGEARAERLGGTGKGEEAALEARYRAAKLLHSLMLWPPGRRATVGICALWPGLAQGLYRWSRG